jgi:hypothetical protein
MFSSRYLPDAMPLEKRSKRCRVVNHCYRPNADGSLLEPGMWVDRSMDENAPSSFLGLSRPSCIGRHVCLIRQRWCRAYVVVTTMRTTVQTGTSALTFETGTNKTRACFNLSNLYISNESCETNSLQISSPSFK